MSPLIEKHSINIQLATISIVLISIVSFTYRVGVQETLYATRIDALENKQNILELEIADVAREGTQRGMKLVEITTELKNISGLLGDIRDRLRKR